jgi:hypothetical protein
MKKEIQIANKLMSKRSASLKKVCKLSKNEPQFSTVQVDFTNVDSNA